MPTVPTRGHNFHQQAVFRPEPAGRAANRGPGRAGNRVPAGDEVDACHDFLMAQIALIEPKFIVPVGGLAAKRLLGIARVTECVGRRFEHDGAVAIPLPHPSGASGWLNDPANREQVAQAASLIRMELGHIGQAQIES